MGRRGYGPDGGPVSRFQSGPSGCLPLGMFMTSHSTLTRLILLGAKPDGIDGTPGDEPVPDGGVRALPLCFSVVSYIRI
jgi:hypothetical protein